MIFFNKIKAVEFIRNYSINSKRNTAYKRVYNNVANKLQLFEKSINTTIFSNNFNYEIAEKFVFFLKNQNLKSNTIRNIISKTFYMFRLMNKRNYKVDFSFEEIQIKLENVTSVYLTIEEIYKLYNLKLSKENKIIIDLFCIGCLTGLRYSDYSKLTSDNLQGNHIIRKTQKTGEQVIIPIHNLVKEIIKKYNGFPLYKKSQQNFNVRLKYCCKQAKINSKILLEYTKGNNVIRKIEYKYNLICTHTARRSFATNAYLSGIPTAQIMLITGHKSEMSFFKYIKITKEENAIKLERHPFFCT